MDWWHASWPRVVVLSSIVVVMWRWQGFASSRVWILQTQVEILDLLASGKSSRFLHGYSGDAEASYASWVDPSMFQIALTLSDWEFLPLLTTTYY